MSTPTLGKRLLTQSSWYSLGNVLGKVSGVALALIHFNPAWLPEAHYGRYDSALALAMVLAPMLSAGLSTGLLRFMATLPDNREREAVPFTAFAIALLIATGAVVLLWPFAGGIGRMFIVGEIDDAMLQAQAGRLAQWVLLLAALEAVVTVPLARLQAQERAWAYSLAQTGKFGLLILANLLFVIVLEQGLQGALQAQVLASGFMAAVVSGALVRREVWRVDVRLVRRMLVFGGPLVLVGLSLPLLHVGDRLLLLRLAAPEELTLYAAATRLAGMVNVVLVQGFASAFAVLGMKALAQGDGTVLHQHSFRLMAVLGGGLALGLVLFSYDALLILAPAGSVYPAASRLILPLALGLMGYGLWVVSVNPLYVHGKTVWVAAIVMVATVLNLALNMVFIPYFGALGAALTTLLSYVFLAGMATVAVRRLEPFPVPWRAVVVVVALVLVLSWGGAFLRDAGVWHRVGGGALLFLLYPLGIWFFRVYSKEELEALRERFLRDKRKRDDE